MALRQGRRADMERAAYYVWFLGTEESRGLRGRQYVAPVVAELVRRERHVEPCKVTLQLSGRGMKIVQHVSRPGTGRPGQVKHFVPDHAVTCAVRQPPPDDDIVSCILLVFNPVTKCPVHVHTYRCDTPETAALLEAQLQTLAGRPENRGRIQQIEARLVERGLLAPPPPPPPPPQPAAAGRHKRTGQHGGSKAGYQEDSSGIGSDDTASPDHRERTSSDEEYVAGGGSSEDLLDDSNTRWRHRSTHRLDGRDSEERRSPEIEDRYTSGVSSTRRSARHRQRSPPAGYYDWSRSRARPQEDDRDDDTPPPPPPQRPPPDVPPAEAREVRGPSAEYSRSWRLSRPPPEEGRPGRCRPRADSSRHRQQEPAAAPPGGEPRPDELLSRIDRWVLSSVAAAESAAAAPRRRHSGRQHAAPRGHSPPEDAAAAAAAAGRLVKARSTDTFLEHDVAREPWRRPGAAQVAEEMRRQSLARYEPVPRSRSSAHVAEELRRPAAPGRDDAVQRCRSSSQVADELRRRLAAREARDARDVRDARDLRESRDQRDPRDPRDPRDTREKWEAARPRHGMQRCRSSASLLERASPEPASGGWRGSGRRWGTLERPARDGPRHREPSRDSERRPHAAREPRVGSRTPDSSERWAASAGSSYDTRGRSRYSVADPRGVREFDYRPSLVTQPY